MRAFYAAIVLTLTGIQPSFSSDETTKFVRLAVEKSVKIVQANEHAGYEVAVTQKTPARNDGFLLDSIAGTSIGASVVNNVSKVRSTGRMIRVFFEFDTVSAEIGVLAEYIPKGVEVLITGHADAVGSAQYNLQLGMRRAQFVAERLSDEGVERTRITVDSRGETDPIAGNDTAVGRAKNRRVEVRVLR